MEDENKKLKSQLAELQKILLQTQKKLSEQRKPTNDERQSFIQLDNERKLRLEAETKLKEFTSLFEQTELELQQTKKQLEDERVSVELGNITIDSLQKKLTEQEFKPPSVDLEALKINLAEAQQELALSQDNLLQERGKALQLETKLSKTEKQLNALKQSAANDSMRHLKEVNELKAIVESLNQQNNASKEKEAANIDADKSTIVELQHQIRELSEKNSSLTSEVDRCLKLTNDAAHECTDIKKVNQELLAENMKLENSIANLNDQLTNMNELHEKSKAINNVLNAQIEQLQETNSSLISDIDILKNNVIEQQNTLNKINEDSALNYDNTINQLNVTITELTNNNNVLNNQIQQLNEKNNQLLAEYNVLLQQKDDIIANIKKTNEELIFNNISLQSNNTNLEDKLKQYTSEGEEINTTNSILNHKIMELTNNIAIVTSQNQHLNEKIAQLNDEHNKSSLEIENLRKTSEDLGSSKHSLEKSVIDLEEQLQKLNNQILEVTTTNEQLNSQILEVNATNNLLNIQVQQLTETNNSLSSENEMNSKLNSEILVDSNKLKQLIQELTDKNQQNLSTIQSLEEQLQQSQSTISELKNEECMECIQLKEQCRSLETIIAENDVLNRNRLSQLQEELSNLSSINSDLLSRLRDAETATKIVEFKLNETLQIHKLEIDNQIAANQDLSIEIDELKVKIENKESELNVSHGQILIIEKRCELLQSELNKREEDMKEAKQKIAETMDKYTKESDINRDLRHAASTKELELKITKDDLAACEAMLENEKQSNLKLMEKIKEDRNQITQLKDQQNKLAKLCEESQNNTETMQTKFQDEKKHLIKELETLQEQFNKERNNYANSFKQMQQDKLTTELATIESLKHQLIELKNVYSIQLQLVQDTKEQ